jgi:class 3 adenylate cyclase/alpha-beta hydrolase superfamily lysophospholipase
VEAIPETRYARADDGVYLAYQAFGDGEQWFVGAPPIFSNVEAIWEHPEPARFLRSMASFSRFVHFDKRGQGMSDRVAAVPTLEQRAADMRAVMDAAGVDRAVVGGISEGGSAAAMVAATYPERVTGLALFGSFARLLAAPDHPIGFDPAFLDVANESWVERWGTPETLTVPLVAPGRQGDLRFLEFINRFERQSSTPGGLRDQLAWVRDIDIRSILPVISAPTLVMHRAGDRLIPVAHGRHLAERIPGARYLELPGDEHVPYFGDSDEVLAELEELVTGRRGAGRADRVLATVVFTDIVSSTEQASAMGDRSWHDLLDRHDAMAKRLVERHGGRVVKATGDGLLATFDGPARGIRCAVELVHAAEQLHLSLRAGAHTGEVEVRGDDVAGIAVHIGSRVAGCAQGGEVLVSRTVRDLVTGSGIAFEDRGEHELKGVPDRWQLFRVVP